MPYCREKLHNTRLDINLIVYPQEVPLKRDNSLI